MVDGGGVRGALWYLYGEDGATTYRWTVKDQPQCPLSSTNITSSQGHLLPMSSHTLFLNFLEFFSLRGRNMVALPLFYFSMEIAKFRRVKRSLCNLLHYLIPTIMDSRPISLTHTLPPRLCWGRSQGVIPLIYKLKFLYICISE